MNKRARIIGWGRAGKAAAGFLERQGYSAVVFDDRLGGDADTPVDLVVASPGVPVTHPLVCQAERQGIEVVGELELGLRALRGPAVGITGTNGKTTITHLVAEVLKRTGRAAEALGNIGKSLTAQEHCGTAVIEMSSFQLERARTPCLDAAVILNISPDHLDRHGTLWAYAVAKARIQQLLKPGGEFFCHSEALCQFPDLFVKRDVVSFGLTREADLFTDGRHIFRNANIESNVPFRYRMGRRCDLENLLAAFALSCALGVTPEEFERTAEEVPRPPHRMEWVREKDGVTYINDSKGTNLCATIAAVDGCKPPVVLIAGGRDKGGDFRTWRESFRGAVKGVVAIGEARALIGEALSPDIQVYQLSDLEEAVILASQLARPAGTVLLSPGCTSFDQFRDFEERGERFCELVSRI